jgi:hypothetical protein
MIERSTVEGFRETFPVIRAYDEAVEALVARFCGELELRLAWRANGPRPPEWLERDARAFYETWNAMPLISPILGLIPKSPPAAGRWMLHLWHDVPNQRLDARVLCVVGGAAESWESLWRRVQIDGHRGQRLAADRRAWRMALDGCSCAWEDALIGLESAEPEAAFRESLARLRGLADALLADGAPAT